MRPSQSPIQEKSVVRIRMKSLGRRHRPFFRICAMDIRSPRDGRAIEELGHHDPMVRNVQARTVLNVNRIRYWLSVGAQPSHKVQALLNRYGVKKPAPGEPWALPEVAPTAPPETAPAATAPSAPTPVATPEAAAPAGTSGGEAPVS
jgi:small subunit ribosomal protein S16